MGRASGGERAVGLPWLRPTAAGLLALTDNPPDRDAVLDCPGTVAHILRYARPTPDPSNFSLTADLLSQLGVSTAAAEFVEHDWPADWTLGCGTALLVGRTAARVAAELAAESHACSADAAWVAALLSPLGKYVGGDAEIGRRLAFRWRLPKPFAVTIGSLALSSDDAAALGGDAGLHRVVQAAVAAAERRHGDIDLASGGGQPPGASLITGGLTPPARQESDLDSSADELASRVNLTARVTAADPGPQLLAKLLRLNAAARSRSGVAIVSDLEDQIDALTRKVVDARVGFNLAVRDAKLKSLAEFAAGAGHEINNPLAVVSGNAQLLLAGEADPDRRRRLEAVIRAARRIHDILIATRQFARPPASTPADTPLAGPLFAACESQRPVANENGVSLEITIPDDLAVRADPDQFRQIVGNMVRNGVEAAPFGGWVRVSAVGVGERVEVAVEDSGPGPSAAAVPHLFDPFYSGRDAGRGRGLGLAQAWQLARQNGGTVAFTPQAGGPTRFTLTLSRAEATARPEQTPATTRRSA